MNIPERKTLIRFILIYMGMFFLLFATLSWFYYTREARKEERNLQQEMQRILLQMHTGRAVELPDGMSLTTLPGNDDPPWKLVEHSGKILLPGSWNRESNQTLALAADRRILDERIERLRIEVLFFMAGAFAVNLFIALILAKISLRPLREANRKVREFTQDIIHDLNAPVTALRINLDAFRRKGDPRRLQMIDTSIHQIESLYRNLETLLQEHPPKAVEPIELRALLEELLGPLRQLYPHARYKLLVPRTTVKIDRNALERIVTNLLQNAVKYGGPDPVITLGIDTEGRFYLRDNGPGIGDAQRLLQRRRQGDLRSPGYGLGLDIVRKLAESCRIPLQIDSAPGEGTVFTFDIQNRILSVE